MPGTSTKPKNDSEVAERHPTHIDVGVPCADFHAHEPIPPATQGGYQTVYIHFHGFNTMSTTRGWYIATSFKCSGHEWRVYMCPSGSKRSSRAGRASFYLRLMSGATVGAHFEVWLNSNIRTKTVAKTFSKESSLNGKLGVTHSVTKSHSNKVLQLLKLLPEASSARVLCELLRNDASSKKLLKSFATAFAGLHDGSFDSDVNSQIFWNILNDIYKFSLQPVGIPRFILSNEVSPPTSAEDQTTICIVGGGPVGLMTACMLLANQKSLRDEADVHTPPIRVIIYGRWRNKVVWAGNSVTFGSEVNNRRRQVVTIQSNVWSEFPKFVKGVLFHSKGVDFAEHWPLGPDSPEEKGFPRNIPLMYIEDKLLSLLQNEKVLEDFGVKPGENSIELRNSKATKEELRSTLKTVDYLILSDGGRSQTEALLKDMGVIDKESFEQHAFKDNLTDTVLGIYLDFRDKDLEGMLSEKESMAVTISNNRFVFNYLPGHLGFGFLNMWLAPEEIAEAIGVAHRNDGTKTTVPCTQASPCKFVLDDDGNFTCPTHGAIFKPLLDENSALWKTIQEALKLYGIPMSCVQEFVKFKLGPYSERSKFYTDGAFDGRKFKAFLLGDAAISVNFRFGRGLNTGLKGAMSLTRTLAKVMSTNRPREADFVDHHGYMNKLVQREVKIRSVDVMRETSPNIVYNMPGQDQSRSDGSYYTEQFKERVQQIIQGRSFSDARLPPDLRHSDRALVHIDNLDQGFVRNLCLSGPWDTATAGGREVEIAKAWWIPEQVLEKEAKREAAGIRQDEVQAEGADMFIPHYLTTDSAGNDFVMAESIEEEYVDAAVDEAKTQASADGWQELGPLGREIVVKGSNYGLK